MIIFLSDLQKEHLSIIQQHSNQVLVDFCKLTIDYLRNGVKQKKCVLAAENLQVPERVIQNVIYALAFLIVEGCKHNLSEANFKSSLAIAGFSQEQQLILIKFYNSKKDEISKGLQFLQIKDPNFQDLLWRFEVQVASKQNPEEVTPMATLNFVLSTPKNFGQLEENATLLTVNEDMSAIKKNVSIHDAKTASECQHVIHNVLLQCDLPNLVHLTQKLDEALKESKSQHTRKLHRAL